MRFSSPRSCVSRRIARVGLPSSSLPGGCATCRAPASGCRCDRWRCQLGRTLTFAIEFFFINPEKTNEPVMKKLAEHAASLRGNMEDYAKAIANPTQRDQPDLDTIKKCAEIGDASAQYQLALHYDRGDGVERDLAQAFLWFKRSSDNNYPYGFLAVGTCYASGRGVAKDPEAAFKHYHQAAKAGLTEGQMRLGMAYKNGVGTAKDDQKAAGCFAKAAEQGNRDAMRLLGQSLAQGTGVAQNLEQAFGWYKQAAEAGDPTAMGLTGQCYVEGKGVTKDLAQGVDWYRRGAEAGDVGCQAEYGDCFHDGRGVEQDLRKSLFWFQKALDQGFKPVAGVVAQLKEKLKE